MNFVLDFPQYDLDVDVFMDIPLGMVFDENIGEWVLKLKKSIYGLKQANKNWFDPLKTGLERRGCHNYLV